VLRVKLAAGSELGCAGEERLDGSGVVGHSPNRVAGIAAAGKIEGCLA
jgi:hypothetical protein